jgi:hypothetical protein
MCPDQFSILAELKSHEGCSDADHQHATRALATPVAPKIIAITHHGNSISGGVN